MLIEFLNELSKKSEIYQLFWMRILGAINDKGKSSINIEKLKTEFNLGKSTYYRMIKFGLKFFDDPTKRGVFMKYDNHTIYIEVFRKKSASEIQKEKESIEYKSKLIIDYFNELTGSKVSHKTKSTLKLISERIEEGFSVEDFKTVIDKKNNEWKDQKNMVKFIRPQTLFSGKFEGYLNEKPKQSNIKNGSKISNLQRITNASRRIKENDWSNEFE